MFQTLVRTKQEVKQSYGLSREQCMVKQLFLNGLLAGCLSFLVLLLSSPNLHKVTHESVRTNL